MVTDAGTKTGCSQTSRGLIRKNGIKVRGRPEPLVHRGPLLAGLQARLVLPFGALWLDLEKALAVPFAPL